MPTLPGPGPLTGRVALLSGREDSRGLDRSVNAAALPGVLDARGENEMSYWWVVWIVFGNLAFVAGIVWLALHYKVKREQNRAEERERLLARFGTGPEVLDLLNSE